MRHKVHIMRYKLPMMHYKVPMMHYKVPVIRKVKEEKTEQHMVGLDLNIT